MYQSEEHIIKKTHSYYKECDEIMFLSKNLYNSCLYEIRQHFFKENFLLSEKKLYHIMKIHESYLALPRKVSKMTLKKCHKTFKGWIEASKDYNQNPSKYKGKPRIPKYLGKTDGRFTTIYEKQAINKGNKLSDTNIVINTQKKNIVEIQIVPNNKRNHKICVIYNKPIIDLQLNKENIVGIDMGTNNILALASNINGLKPILVKGGKVKSINQWYNKIKSKIQSKLEKGRYSNNNIEEITEKRNREINHIFHNISNYVIKICKENNVGTIVIGKNISWKNEIELGKKNNQNFCNIPHSRLINQIKYKAELYGIVVETTEESYTSKCSWIDNEELKHHTKYVGRRISRGMFKSKNHIRINADVNGALNMIRKVFPKAFDNFVQYYKGHGIAGSLGNPVSVYI